MKLTMTIARGALLSFASVGALSCSGTTETPTTQLNIDRPVDVAFACYGGLRLTASTMPDDIVLSAQPVQACDDRSQVQVGNTPPRSPGQEDRPGKTVPIANWVGFVLQSGPGTVAVSTFQTKPSSAFGGGDVDVKDADLLTPGNNSISVGEDPVAIATDRVGCYEVIANAGSCDLSTLNINSVFESDPIVMRLDVKNGSGTVIRAKPAAMTFEPAGGAIGEACPAQATGLAYIAYPSCHLVAGVDVSTGTIVTAKQFDAAGIATDVDPTTITCADECGGTIAPTPGKRPVALDLEVENGTPLLAIGSDNSNVLTMFTLDPSTFFPNSTPISVPLEDTTGRLGVTALAISPLITMGGAAGIINDDGSTFAHQFVYAVTTDGTVRVVDVSGAPRECDTQVDPRYITSVSDIDRLSCFKVGDPATPPRRALAKGPGIALIGDAIPTSVDFVTVGSTIPTDETRTATPARLIGHFAIVTAANGQTFVVNVDNDDFADFQPTSEGGGIAAPMPLVLPHQLHDAVIDRGALAQVNEGMPAVAKFVCNDSGPDPAAQGGNAGGPRAVGNPALNVPTGTIAAEKVGGLPSVRQVRCVATTAVPDERPVSELSFSAPVAVRESVFPDLLGLRSDENWTLTWEGSLSLDRADTAIDGPATRFGQLFVDNASSMRMVDNSRPFCDAGVEPYDILQLRGCDPSIGDAGCSLGYTCFVHPQSQVTGLGACMLQSEAERLSNACKEFLTSLRRYTVKTAKTGELQLIPRKVELRTTPLDGCTDDAQCKSLADYAAKNASSANPVDDHTAADPKTYACQIDPDRPLKGTTGTGKRCLLTCDTDTECSIGTVCHPNAGAAPRLGYCMEGVIPPQSCVNAMQRYDLRSSEAFTVIGSRQGYIHPVIADAGGFCVKNPNANPYQVGRLPLNPPPCNPAADPDTGQLPGLPVTFEPNPCKKTVDETEFQLNYIPGTCTLNTPDENLVTRQAEAIQYRSRGMKLTIVDPTYPGDGTCHGDRGGGLVNVPLVVSGYQIAFRQTAGFTPLTLGISPSFPIKVLRGPQESIWVVDQGDFLSTSLSTPSTRGRVYRIESRSLGTINLLQ